MQALRRLEEAHQHRGQVEPVVRLAAWLEDDAARGELVDEEEAQLAVDGVAVVLLRPQRLRLDFRERGVEPGAETGRRLDPEHLVLRALVEESPERAAERRLLPHENRIVAHCVPIEG
jgi:hypothetical protein